MKFCLLHHITMLRHQITRISTLNNISRINKRLCATKCFNNNKPDIEKKPDSVKLIDFQINFEYNDFCKKARHNLFSEDDQVERKRALYGAIVGLFSGSVIGGCQYDWWWSMPFGISGMVIGIVIGIMTPYVLPISGVIIFCAGIGFTINKLFVKKNDHGYYYLNAHI